MDFDELKEIIKAQWDIVLYVLMIGAILAWALFVTLLLPAMGQTFEKQVFKSSGENIQITWEWPAEKETFINGFAIFRQSSVTSQPFQVGSTFANARQFNYPMPSGATREYRFRVMVKFPDGSLSPAGNEVMVIRR